MGRGRRASFIMAVGIWAAFCTPIAAQVIKAQPCPSTVGIPGGSDPEDSTAHRCNLDNAPALRSSLDSIPTPLYAREAHSTMTIVVDPDGRVNAGLTRYWSGSGDTLFQRQMLEAVQGLDYEIGTIAGEAIRYGHGLVVLTGTRTDTVPERLRWRYIRGVIEDTLVGTWERLSAELQLTPEHDVHTAESITRVLTEMRVLLPEQRTHYCLVLDGPDRTAVRNAVEVQLYGRRSDWPYGSLGPPGCEVDVRYRRYRIGMPLRTGGERTVVTVSGDVLQSWPPGLNGRPLPAWEAYCVVPELPEKGNGAQCELTPMYSGDPAVDGVAVPLLEPPTDPGAPVAVAVRVTTVGAFRIDTLHASIDVIPRLEDRAVLRHGVRACMRGSTWSAAADWPGGGEIVAWLTLPAGRLQRGDAQLVKVGRPRGDSRFEGCAPSRVSNETMALFTLGGVGQPLQGPVRFCLNEPDCAQDFYIESSRHELAPQPHVAFRLADIRESARRGDQVHFRLTTDRVIEGLVPFVVVRTPSDTFAWTLGRTQDREFDFSLHYSPGYPPETEFWVYLSTAGQR